MKDFTLVVSTKAAERINEESRLEGENTVSMLERQTALIASADICFMMDCTGSMRSWIKTAQDKLKQIIDEIRIEYPKAKFRVAFVGYRDISDGLNRFSIKDFSDDYDETKSFIGSCSAMGGADGPEVIIIFKKRNKRQKIFLLFSK